MINHRMGAGFSQQDLADRMGLDPSMISRWETKKISVPVDWAALLCQIFRCSPEDLDIKLKGTPEEVRQAIADGRPTKFKLFCNNSKLTTAEIAKLTGVHRNTITEYRRGTRYPSQATQQKLAQGLGVNRSDLFSDNEIFGE